MGAKRVLVIQQCEGEELGAILPVMSAKGFEPVYIRLHKNDVAPQNLDGYAALVILGGPMAVYEQDVYPFLKEELRLIKDAIRRDLPTLGICLGAQLMANAAGGRVYKGKAKEIGWYDVELTFEASVDGLVSDFPKRVKVFQWHGDTFDLPPGVTRLAGSELFRNQAFRVGKNCYALQFHFEVTAALVRDFLSAGEAELETLKGQIDPKRVIDDTPLYIDTLTSLGNIFFKRFFDLAG